MHTWRNILFTSSVPHVYLQVRNWHLDTASLTRILKFFSRLADSLHLCEYQLLIDLTGLRLPGLAVCGTGSHVEFIQLTQIDLNTRQVIVHIIWMTV